MSSKKQILIFGAGAIGRGFLPLILQKYGYEFSFVDKDKKIADLMKARNKYRAAMTGEKDYEFYDIDYKDCFEFGEKIDVGSYDLVFSCVGPNNIHELTDYLKDAKAVISCENDASSAVKLRTLTGNKNIYFGIPDAIASNTASEELKKADPLMTVSEQGVLVLEEGNYELPEEIMQLSPEDLEMHWLCKMFIHNAPHAITAYLGWLKGHKYIHEAMADEKIDQVVAGSIEELTQAIIISGLAKEEFAVYYRDKELKRFRNKLLFDPITRVAREPIRKLGKDNRLVLGMRLCSFHGIEPKNIALGIKAALKYNNPDDKEARYIQNLRKTISENQILRDIAGLELLDPLNDYAVKKTIGHIIND